jgi:hypothetical protein
VLGRLFFHKNKEVQMSNQLQDAKHVTLISPGVIRDNASWTGTEIDTRGYEHLTVVFQVGATDIAMAALKLQSGDASGTLTDVSGLNFSGGTAIDGTATSLPSATDDNKEFVFQVDLRGQKRYWNIVATAGDGSAGTYGSALAILGRGTVNNGTVAEIASGKVIRL